MKTDLTRDVMDHRAAGPNIYEIARAAQRYDNKKCHCGELILEGDRYCIGCGQSTSHENEEGVNCTNCNRFVSKWRIKRRGATHCPQCGHVLTVM